MPSDWEKIEQIYQEALSLAPDERAAFIQAATGGDEDLRREIESLLSFEPKAERFLAGNALHSTAKGLVKEQIRSLVGQQIGAYKILSLARGRRHGRSVQGCGYPSQSTRRH